MENRNLKIGVVGLGLIGGSILKSLNNLGYFVVGVSKSSHMEAQNFCSLASVDVKDIDDCDVVFVCSKMSETLDILDKLENIVKPGCIVTDVCSLKRFVNNKKRSYDFVGSHPMAGTEFSGFEHSFAELFFGAKWILNKPNKKIKKLIKEMGSKPVIMDEHSHDKAACLVSHLPMLISCALFNTVLKDNKVALKIASSGFRDTTRLALTNASLALDMLELNSDNFDIFIDDFIQNLKKLKNMPKAEFIQTLNSIQKIRSQMYDNDGKNRLSYEEEI